MKPELKRFKPKFGRCSYALPPSAHAALHPRRPRLRDGLDFSGQHRVDPHDHAIQEISPREGPGSGWSDFSIKHQTLDTQHAPSPSVGLGGHGAKGTYEGGDAPPARSHDGYYEDPWSLYDWSNLLYKYNMRAKQHDPGSATDAAAPTGEDTNSPVGPAHRDDAAPPMAPRPRPAAARTHPATTCKISARPHLTTHTSPA